MKETSLLFVYGSLRKESTHNHLLQDAEWLGEVYTLGFLYLIDWYPGMVLSHARQKTPQKVYGDLYRVSNTDMERLDSYEGREYDKILLSTIDQKEQKRQALAYIFNQNIEAKSYATNSKHKLISRLGELPSV